MSRLDRFQHWSAEIGGTILFLLALYRVFVDTATGIHTSDIAWYIGIFALAFAMMGHKGITKKLLGR